MSHLLVPLGPCCIAMGILLGTSHSAHSSEVRRAGDGGPWAPAGRYPHQKRMLDALGATLLLILASPLLLGIALLIWASLGRPVLLRQRRAGRHERPFLLLKLRTMTDARDAEGRLLPDAQRLTRLGRVLRRLSVDELPQLWNVLRGEMSLVGPRPLYPEYLPCYSARERTRHSVPPGVTGLAQVSGRRALAWDARLEFDAQYAERQSLPLDLWIFARTLWDLALRRSGADGEIPDLTVERLGVGAAVSPGEPGRTGAGPGGGE